LPAGRRGTGRWLRPVGLAAFALLLGTALQSGPHPSLHGAGLAVLIALVCVVGGTLGLLVLLDRRPGILALEIGLLLAVIGGSAVLVWFVPDGPGFVGGFVVAAAAASLLPRRLGQVIGVVALVVLAVVGVASDRHRLTPIFVSELGAVAFYQLGDYARRLRERTEQSERLVAELARSRQAQVRAAAMAERQHLAREMHDVLAHSLSGLVLHLEGARLLAAREGAGARLTDTIERAHHLAQGGLDEARQAIGMLRDDDLPGPDRLRALAEEFERDSGVRCRFDVSGRPVTLGSPTRLTLYRVAQEALTNVRRHARARRVDLLLGYEPDGTRLIVEDFGTAPGPSIATDGHGYGVTGMRERAELLGGTLAAEPTETGFRVALWVPS
jgi:signal transduction histidine kinase